MQSHLLSKIVAVMINTYSRRLFSLILIAFKPNHNMSSSKGLKVSAGKGGIVFGTLQICKDTRVFNERVKKIEKTDKDLAEYLRQTRPLSLRVAKLT